MVKRAQLARFNPAALVPMQGLGVEGMDELIVVRLNDDQDQTNNRTAYIVDVESAGQGVFHIIDNGQFRITADGRQLIRTLGATNPSVRASTLSVNRAGARGVLISDLYEADEYVGGNAVIAPFEFVAGNYRASLLQAAEGQSIREFGVLATGRHHYFLIYEEFGIDNRDPFDIDFEWRP